MKTNGKFILTAIFAAWSAVNAFGGVKLTSGSVDFLKQEKQVNVEYVYDGMTVNPDRKDLPREMAEKDFIAKRVAQFDEKQAGRGESWRERWINSRADSYEPSFCDGLNQRLSAKKIDLQFGFFRGAKYTLILKTTHTELGWKFSDVIKHPFLINAEATFVETQNRTNSPAEITILKASGSAEGSDFTGRGLAEAYGNAGKQLGVFLSRGPK
jgi:hypothetical protein